MKLSNPQSSSQISAITVLVVECPAKDVQVFKKLLSEETGSRYTVEAASTQKAGLERAVKGGVDAVFLNGDVLGPTVLP